MISPPCWKRSTPRRCSDERRDRHIPDGHARSTGNARTSADSVRAVTDARVPRGRPPAPPSPGADQRGGRREVRQTAARGARRQVNSASEHGRMGWWRRLPRKWKLKPPDLTLSVLTFFMLVSYIVTNMVGCAQLREMKKAARLDQRAWLAVTVTSDEPTPGKKLTVAAHVTNSGKTFARHVSICFFTTIRPEMPNQALALPDFASCESSNWVASSPVVAPNSQWNSQLPVAPEGQSGLSDDLVGRLADGRSVAWAYGLVKYKDIFDVAHWTQFCYLRIVQDGTVLWTACGVRNEIDGE